MTKKTTENNAQPYRCPECHRLLKKRRTRAPDECEMLCGGCGASFDVCDLETVDLLKKES